MASICAHCRIEFESDHTSVFRKYQADHPLNFVAAKANKWKEIVPGKKRKSRVPAEIKTLCPFCAVEFRLKLEHEALHRQQVAGLIGLGLILLILLGFILGS